MLYWYIDITGHANRRRSPHTLWCMHMNAEISQRIHLNEIRYHFPTPTHSLVHPFDSMCVVNFIDSMFSVVPRRRRLLGAFEFLDARPWPICTFDFFFCFCVQKAKRHAQCTQHNLTSDDSHLRRRRRRWNDWQILLHVKYKHQIAERRKNKKRKNRQFVIRNLLWPIVYNWVNGVRMGSDFMENSSWIGNRMDTTSCHFDDTNGNFIKNA